MRIGRLDRKINVQRYVTNQDDYGEPIQAWTTVYSGVWASRRQTSGREALSADQVKATATVVFQLHYKAVYPTDRVICEGQVYDVQSVNEIGRRKAIELICELKPGAHSQEDTLSNFDYTLA